jgi:hypothetical protein
MLDKRLIWWRWGRVELPTIRLELSRCVCHIRICLAYWRPSCELYPVVSRWVGGSVGGKLGGMYGAGLPGEEESTDLVLSTRVESSERVCHTRNC